jgi:hypothetical protein
MTTLITKKTGRKYEFKTLKSGKVAVYMDQDSARKLYRKCRPQCLLKA